MEEGWIDPLITAAVMGGETRGQRLIARLSDKKAEHGRGDEERAEESRVWREERGKTRRGTDVVVDGMRRIRGELSVGGRKEDEHIMRKRRELCK